MFWCPVGKVVCELGWTVAGVEEEDLVMEGCGGGQRWWRDRVGREGTGRGDGLVGNEDLVA